MLSLQETEQDILCGENHAIFIIKSWNTSTNHQLQQQQNVISRAYWDMNAVQARIDLQINYGGWGCWNMASEVLDGAGRSCFWGNMVYLTARVYLCWISEQFGESLIGR